MTDTKRPEWMPSEEDALHHTGAASRTLLMELLMASHHRTGLRAKIATLEEIRSDLEPFDLIGYQMSDRIDREIATLRKELSDGK